MVQVQQFGTSNRHHVQILNHFGKKVKLKVGKFLWLILTIVEVTYKKLAGKTFHVLPSPPVTILDPEYS